MPREPGELAGHNCIGFTLLEHYNIWHFKRDAEERDISIKGNITSNSSEAIREIVISGQGISLSPEWLFAADVEQGKVSIVLDDYQTTALPVSAVLSRERRRSARTMAFVDFLREHL
ncbi:LysR substrate binding domain protein [compost metagenome]